MLCEFYFILFYFSFIYFIFFFILSLCFTFTFIWTGFSLYLSHFGPRCKCVYYGLCGWDGGVSPPLAIAVKEHGVSMPFWENSVLLPLVMTPLGRLPRMH